MSVVSRRSLLAAAAVSPVVAAGPVAPSNAAAGRRRPNIVFILADDLGWGELGAYGQRIIETPHLDRLAREGVRFTDAYAAAPICAPSRYSILTGRHQGRAAIRHNSINEMPAVVQSSLPHDQRTFAETLQAAGYRTGIFGKWGFGPDDRARDAVMTPGRDEGDPSHPLQRGFDEFCGFIYHHHATHGYWTDYWWEGNRRVPLAGNADGAESVYTPDLYTERGLRFMTRQARAGRPFFAWFSTILPHTPNEVPDYSQYDHLPFGTDSKKHAAQVSHLDRHVGRVLAHLDRLGIAEETLVVFTSDNGPHDETALYGGTDPVEGPGVTSALDVELFNSNGPFRGAKQNLHEGGIRVPLIAWGPGVLAPTVRGSVSARPTAGYDLPATFVAAAGAGRMPGTDGISLLPLLRGRRQQSHPHLYWERWRAGAPSVQFYVNDRLRQGHFTQAVRRGRWKLLRWAPGTNDDGSVDVNPTGTQQPSPVPGVVVPKDQWSVELYDLHADPGETVDLAALRPDVVAALAEIMDAEHTPYTALPNG